MKTHRILSGLGQNSLVAPTQLHGPDTAPATASDTAPQSRDQRRTSAQSTHSARRRMSSSIRHSQAEGFEFDPLMVAVQARKEKERRRERERELDESTRSSSTANDFDQSEAVHYEDGIRKERVKEAGQLASVFLNIRKGIQDSHNVASGLNERPELDQQPERRHTRVSRTTLQRAEKVKVMLNLQYFAIFQAQKPVHSPPRYPGVEGVYNPLQIIRNRRVRKKFHKASQLPFKTLPYASEAFSRNKRKQLWQVDLEELAHDFNWRTQHWHDLVNPRGQLWFPVEEEQQHKHTSRLHVHRSRGKNDSSEALTNMHDRLFQIDGEDSSKDSSKDDLLDAPRSRKRDIITDRLKIRSKSPFKRGHNSSLSELSKVNDEKPSQSAETPPVSQTSLHQQSNSLGLLTDINIEPIHAQERIVSNASAPEVGNSTPFPSAVHTRNTSLNVSSAGLMASLENSTTPSADLEYVEFRLHAELNKSIRQATVIAAYGGHSIHNKRELYRNLVSYERLFQDFSAVEKLHETLSTGILLPYEQSLIEKSERLQTIHNELATDFSTRVDKLLLLSDRTIGEVNTTLSLEARKLTEKFEKLGPLHRRKDALVWFAYWMLENFVVLVLWIVWIGFSLGRLFKFLVKLLWKTTKWLLY